MTKRTQIKQHIHTMEEIGNIMAAMKNLALIEINKITKYIFTQEKVAQTIHDVGADFLGAYPEGFIQMQPEKIAAYILIGSERGFCGAFNENIMQLLETVEHEQAILFVVGRKLSFKILERSQSIKIIDGSNTAEEIKKVIKNLLNFLEQLQIGPGQWGIIFNSERDGKVETTLLRPFEEFKQKGSRYFSHPPLLNQSKEVFIFDFINQYLFSLLYLIFYESFMAENYQRIRHLENSIGRLEKNKLSLTHHLNLLRQEEITEEIQIIMLSAEAIIEELLQAQVPRQY